jgi:tape measure domain-containing protein
MPEFILTLKLDDKDYKVKIISDSEDAEKLRKKFEDTGSQSGRTINELRNKLKNLTDVFERSEIGTPEFQRLKAEIDKTKTALEQAAGSVKNIDDESQSLPSRFAQWGNIVTGINQGLEVARKLYSIISKPIEVAGQFEQLEVQFEVLLGGLDKARKLIGDLTTLGASTPLELMDLQKNTKLLLSFGVAGEEVVDILRMLGDVSGGDAERLSQLTLAYSQMQSTGRLMGQDLLQMVNAGFNPLKIISEDTGKSMRQLKKDMEAGAISSDMVTDAFKKATSEGGQFFNMMEKQSKTYEGMVSNLNDTITMMLKSLGELLLPIAKNLVNTIAPIIKEITGLFEAYSETSKQAFAEQADYVKKLDDALPPLLKQYDDLKSKAFLNKEEQAKLQIVINGIAEALPTAVTRWDEYGKALGIARDKVEELMTAEKARLQYLNKEAIEAQEDDKKRLLRRISETQTTLNQGYEEVHYIMAGELVTKQKKLTDKRIRELAGSISSWQKDIAGIEAEIKRLSGDAYNVVNTTPGSSGGGNADVDKDKINKTIKEELDLHKKQKELNEISLQDYEAYLVKRLATLADKTHDEKMLRLQFIEEMQKVAKEKDELRLPNIEIEGSIPEDIDLTDWEKQQAEEQLKIHQLKSEAVNDQYAREYELLKIWKEQELLEYEGITEAKVIIDEIYADKKAEIDRKVSEHQLDLASKTLGSIAQLLSKQTAAYKLMAAAQTIIETYKAATAALAPPPIGAGPLFGPILAGTTIATGLLNVAKIMGVVTEIKGYETGGKLPRGKVGFFEGYENEIVAPEKDFIGVVNDLLRNEQITASKNFGISEAVLAVERRLIALNVEANGGSTNKELIDEMKRTNKRIDDLLKVPILVDEDACGKIYNIGRKLSGYKT